MSGREKTGMDNGENITREFRAEFKCKCTHCGAKVSSTATITMRKMRGTYADDSEEYKTAEKIAKEAIIDLIRNGELTATCENCGATETITPPMTMNLPPGQRPELN